MPMSTVRIHQVTAVPTGKPGCVSHLVTATTFEQFYTLNVMRAALCECAQRLGAEVRITWKDGRMKTRDIVDVSLIEEHA